MRTALITGGTRGIGKVVAKSLITEGWNLILTYLSDEEAANKTVSELIVIYPKASITLLRVNCSDLASIDLIERFLKDNKISLDSIVFNAGLTNRASFDEIKIEDWQEVFNVNVTFPTFLLQRLETKINDGSCIVFTGSLMGIHPHSLSLSYGVSKAAVHALVKNLVKILAARKIRVNAIAPGFVDTDWQKSKPMKIKESINKKIALGRFSMPEELGDAYLLLINNSYINGEIIVVDGGYSMQ